MTRNWWNWQRELRGRLDEAGRFLNTGRVGGSEFDGPSLFFGDLFSGTRRSGCQDSSQCAVGFKCVDGYCQGGDFIQANSTIGAISQGCGDGESGDDCPPSTVDNGCTKTGCGDEPDDCCGDVRCCRYFAVAGELIVQCECGECEDERACTGFCDSYFKATGDIAAGCRNNVNNQPLICDECDECGTQNLCFPKQDPPCFCREKPCEDCYDCLKDGLCYRSQTRCLVDDEDDEDDDDEEELADNGCQCNTGENNYTTICGGGGCPSGYSVVGTIQAAGETCTICSISTSASSQLKIYRFCCDCDEDCPAGYICTDQGCIYAGP